MNPLQKSIADLRNNPQQWQAFNTQEHCVVLAPPGSGKTKLLATRAAYDLTNRIPRPQGAACITLTNAAADELRGRVASLGTEPRSTSFIGTVHGFALTRIVLPFAKPAGLGEIAELKIASRSEKNQAMTQSINEIFPYADKYELRLIRSTIERNRKLIATEEQWNLSGSNLRAAARLYEEKLRTQGLMDFDNVIVYAVDLVEQHQFVRRVLTAKYSHLYVDEYQDLAPGLDRIIKALCFDYRFASALFAVGDPDQAVYGWTGTRPELLIELAQAPGVAPVYLETNYRCGSDIILIAQRLLDGSRRISGKRVGGRIEAHYERAGFHAQCASAAQLARDLEMRGIPLKEIAVLCSTHDECIEAAAALRTAGVPASVRGSEYEQTPATLLVEGLAAWAVMGREASGRRLGDLLRRWCDVLTSHWSMKAATTLVEILITREGRGAEPAFQFLAEIISAGLQDAINAPDHSDESNAVSEMTYALTAGQLAHMSLTTLAERAKSGDRVQVTTTSSAKGLEFDAIILLGADEGKMPHFSSVGDQAKLDEDRRKFYVSLTRARDEVHIFYSGFDDRYGRIRPNGPSRFLNLLGIQAGS